MCGIAGLLFRSGTARPGPEALETTARTMADAMAHRGPDGDGVWVSADGALALSHRRLAIVDLSDAAAQPMSNGSGTVWITYNGEIYNHLALRAELEAAGHQFRTDHSDTEVLVHGYTAWGLDGLVRRLDGMFAFAIWDTERKVLSIARDRVGIKPVYFTTHAGAFRFASEIKAILTDPAVPREMDPRALNHFLSFMVTPAPLTLFKDIHKLPAAHVMEVDAEGQMTVRRYWDAVPGQVAEEDDDLPYEEGILERLEAAIDKRMMSDVPFGVFLSGGIDSSANVALMSRLMDRPVDTFTVGFKDHKHLNELDYAAQVADEFKANHHEVLIDESDMTGYLDDLIHHQDEPIADWVCVPLYFVSKLAKDSGVTVVQVGEGSDEQFCGYGSYMTYLKTAEKFYDPYGRLPAPLRGAMGATAMAAGKHLPALDKVTEVLHRSGRGHELFWSGANAFWNVHKQRLFRKGAQTAIGGGWPALESAGLDMGGLGSADSGEVIDAYMAELARSAPNAGTLTRMIYNEFRLRLPELLLMRVDKITMSTSVEGRVPFLDHALVEYSQSIPQFEKVPGTTPKELLKTALTDILPKEIIHRPKMGFAAPVAHWLRGEFGGQAEATVMGSKIIDEAGFDRDHILARFKAHRTGRADNALHLWTLFNLASWYDAWIDA